MQGVEASSCIPVRLRLWSRLTCLGTVLAVAFGCMAQDGKVSATPAVAGQAADVKEHSTKNSKPAKGAAGDTERKKQIADESAQLLDMALALKAEVDKTTKDTLSLNVIKKADQIEKLAKSVKDKMKQSSGS
ncbi:MAG: hypothetical protein JST28_15380 [Acidobacteria bacterium]|nr:hypothetical protein [Acidobacteriota bacterium]